MDIRVLGIGGFWVGEGAPISEGCSWDFSFLMAQYVYTMHRVSKVVPPNRTLIKDVSLSFFPGAKIGVLGLNGAGKSTVLRIMAGVDKEV